MDLNITPFVDILRNINPLGAFPLTLNQTKQLMLVYKWLFSSNFLCHTKRSDLLLINNKSDLKTGITSMQHRSGEESAALSLGKNRSTALGSFAFHFTMCRPNTERIQKCFYHKMVLPQPILFFPCRLPFAHPFHVLQQQQRQHGRQEEWNNLFCILYKILCRL